MIQILSSFDPTLGAKPTKAEEANGKPADQFKDQFSVLLSPVIKHDKQNTVIALNAIGYTLEHLTKCGDFDEFKAKVTNATPVSPQEFLDVTTSFQAKNDDPKLRYGANLLLGFAQALCECKSIQWVLLERKGSNGKALDYESSWIKYAAVKDTPKPAAASTIGTP
jgi:hypothetical protein